MKTETSRFRGVAAGGRGYTHINYDDGSTIQVWDDGGITQTMPMGGYWASPDHDPKADLLAWARYCYEHSGSHDELCARFFDRKT